MGAAACGGGLAAVGGVTLPLGGNVSGGSRPGVVLGVVAGGFPVAGFRTVVFVAAWECAATAVKAPASATPTAAARLETREIRRRPASRWRAERGREVLMVPIMRNRHSTRR